MVVYKNREGNVVVEFRGVMVSWDRCGSPIVDRRQWVETEDWYGNEGAIRTGDDIYSAIQYVHEEGTDVVQNHEIPYFVNKVFSGRMFLFGNDIFNSGTYFLERVGRVNPEERTFMAAPRQPYPNFFGKD